MMRTGRIVLVVLVSLVVLGMVALPPTSAQEKKPNILVIMGDDIGIRTSASIASA